ncbi:MAG TPA: ATP-binding protein [Candidatus Binataceae bacterium]|nr:ATP-binding protein [Candidatus Binataceae bacterium]
MSIRLRLTIYWALILAGILTLATLAAYQFFAGQRWASLDAALLEEADDTATAIQKAGLPGAIEIVKSLSLERDIAVRRRARLVMSTGVVADFGDMRIIPPQLDPETASDGIYAVEGHPSRFAVSAVKINGHKGLLEDGADVSAVMDSLEQFRITLMLVVPLLLVLCVTGGYWIVGRALEPIATMSAGLTAIQPNMLSSRLAPPPADDEVARLTRSINALLERLERASIAERRFASDAAHELRTPLTVLRTGLEVALARERSATELLAALTNALAEVIAMCKMADDLLMLARLDRESTLERSDVDLAAVAGEIASNVEPLAQERGIAFTTRLGSGAVVSGNPLHLRRVLINLLDNALKFAPQGGAVELDLERVDGKVTMRVTDNGPGIPPADLPLVFERFYRSKAARAEGSGLGLSLCKEVVRMHGGEIAIANRPSGGCEAIVSLPAASG